MSDSLRPSAPTCATCGKPATCYGRYEGRERKTFGCDDCCGHGNEDGECRRIEEYVLPDGTRTTNRAVAERAAAAFRAGRGSDGIVGPLVSSALWDALVAAATGLLQALPEQVILDTPEARILDETLAAVAAQDEADETPAGREADTPLSEEWVDAFQVAYEVRRGVRLDLWFIREVVKEADQKAARVAAGGRPAEPHPTASHVDEVGATSPAQAEPAPLSVERRLERAEALLRAWLHAFDNDMTGELCEHAADVTQEFLLAKQGKP